MCVDCGVCVCVCIICIMSRKVGIAGKPQLATNAFLEASFSPRLTGPWTPCSQPPAWELFIIVKKIGPLNNTNIISILRNNAWYLHVLYPPLNHLHTTQHNTTQQHNHLDGNTHRSSGQQGLRLSLHFLPSSSFTSQHSPTDITRCWGTRGVQ